MAPQHNSYASSLSVSTSTMSSSSSSSSGSLSEGSSLFAFSPLSSNDLELPSSRTTSAQNSPLSTPPPEELIPPPYERHRALLLLSVQRAPLSDPSAGGMPHAQRTRRNISRVLAAARAAQPPPLIVHVRHEGESGDPDERGTPGWELWTDVREGEVVLDKRKMSAWSKTPLSEWIDPNAEVVVVGTGSDACVVQTCKDALKREHPVMLISGAHCASDRAAMYGGPHGITKPAREVEEEVERELEDLDVSLVDMDMVEDIFDGR